MARKYLSPSLDRLFDEINDRWPKRDRRTDGWYRPPSVGKSVGHNLGQRGLVHAIDVDSDGIDENFIMANIYKGGNVLRYWIWNRGIYHRRDGWARKPYYGPSPHTDHIHIEINQTVAAEQYKGHWGIATGKGGGNLPPSDPGFGGIGGAVNRAIEVAMNEGGRDYRGELIDLGNWQAHGAEYANGNAKAHRTLRR